MVLMRKILPEPSGDRRSAQIVVGGADQPEIEIDHRSAAHPGRHGKPIALVEETLARRGTPMPKLGNAHS
jgi:hypothetical protein